MDNGSLLTIKPVKELFADPGSVTGAMLTGCKNISAAVKTGEHELEAPDWGIRLSTAQPLRDGLRAVGIRAHHFDPAIVQNRFPVRLTSEIEQPFEYAAQFRYENQKDTAPDLWRLFPKEQKSGPMPNALGVAPENVLPLY
jgi:molybdate transport system ATP-binding protein